MSWFTKKFKKPSPSAVPSPPSFPGESPIPYDSHQEFDIAMLQRIGDIDPETWFRRTYPDHPDLYERYLAYDRYVRKKDPPSPPPPPQSILGHLFKGRIPPRATQ